MPSDPRSPKILVRLPNWLGDLVMSSGFLGALRARFPGAAVDAIVKAELAGLVPFLPQIDAAYPFSRRMHRGPVGLHRFATESVDRRYDLFFCLPDSLSAALMGAFLKCGHRVGYRSELRSPFLTQAIARPAGLHRVEEYLHLLAAYLQTPVAPAPVVVRAPVTADLELPRGTRIVINVNSAAQSRRLPAQRGAELLRALLHRVDGRLLLVGSRGERAHVAEVLARVPAPERIDDYTGKLTLAGLTEIIARADLVLSTDSGIAHLANALGKPLVVLFGAGDERSTAPYNPGRLKILRRPGFPCAPCVSNTCRVFDLPACLIQIPDEEILQAIEDLI